MGLKKGYKLTEVGVTPNEWEVKTYGEIFEFLSTATYSRAELTYNNEIEYVHYGDIHTKFHTFLDLNNSTLPTITQEQAKQYHLINDGDVIMADASEDYSGIGKSIEVKNVNGKKAISGLHTFLLRDKHQMLVNGFRAYLHTNPIIKTQYDKLATGMKVYGVSRTNLKTIFIPVPTKSEQTAIATALSDADALISSLEKLIAKKRNIKQGAMQQLLKPKKGWVKKRLGDVLKIKHGKGQKDVANESGPYPILGSGGIMGRANKFLYDKPSVLIGRKGTIDEPRFMDIPFWTVDTLFYSEIFKEHDAKFIYYLFQLIDWYLYNEASGVPSLNAKTIENIERSFPPLKEDESKISAIISDMDNEIVKLEAKLWKCKTIKQGTIQNLLTGRIRLLDGAGR
jgi:type I restriction enzyme S subunit